MQVGFRFGGTKSKEFISDNIYFFSAKLEEPSAESEGKARQLKVYGPCKIFEIVVAWEGGNDP